jgi:hypothetical protein
VEALQCERASHCRLFAEFKDRGFGKYNTSALGTNWPQVITDSRQIMMILIPQVVINQNMVVEARLMEHVIESFDLTNETISPKKAREAREAIQKTADHIRPYSFFVAIATPDYSRATRAVAQTQTEAKEALIACALERYRLANGKYPVTLAALTPQFIAAIPHDVITGEPLKYRLDGNLFILYSVGWNETDDGGKIVMSKDGKSVDSAQGDWVWPPYQEK